MTIVSDPRYLLSSSSHTQGGTVRWMSPERIAPEQFGFKNSRPTISSDCYALGMVIYETISGNLPFHKDTDLTVSVKVVVKGEHPPRGVRFTAGLWGMLERCWASKPSNRPSIEDVLRCMETSSTLLEPLSPRVDEGTHANDNDWDSATGSSGGNSINFFAADDHVQPPPIPHPPSSSQPVQPMSSPQPPPSSPRLQHVPYSPAALRPPLPQHQWQQQPLPSWSPEVQAPPEVPPPPPDTSQYRRVHSPYSSSLCDTEESEMESGSSSSQLVGHHQPQDPPEKKKRTRTLTTPHQSAVLHALLAQVCPLLSPHAFRSTTHF